MSNQSSSNQEVSLQADVGNLPNNTVAVLGALSPILQAITADNVNPLAVVQVEALGTCFHLNGELAGKIPDLLRRNTSYRLERLAHYVGWRGNDTASHMAKTAGGRAASVLSLAVIELYKEESAGDLLYQLSSKLLPAETNQSSRTQIGQVARTLGNKLAAFGFGNHLALHVTRVRQAYFDSGVEVPANLLVFPTVDTMTEFLHSLSRALQEENSLLYFQGCKGVGHMLAIAMALCPDDCLVTVENEVIFQGARRSVVFDIQSAPKTQFSIESIIYAGGKPRNDPRIVSVESGRRLFRSGIRLKWDGCLADALDLALATLGAKFTLHVRIACVELISAILTSVSGTDLCTDNRYKTRLPSTGFRGVLGSDALIRVRETLKRVFLCEPSFTIVQCDKAYDDLCVSLANAVPPTSCECTVCFSDGRFTDGWTLDGQPRTRVAACKVTEVWKDIDWLISRGIIASVVGENTCIRMSIDQRRYGFLMELQNAVVDSRRQEASRESSQFVPQVPQAPFVPQVPQAPLLPRSPGQFIPQGQSVLPGHYGPQMYKPPLPGLFDYFYYFPTLTFGVVDLHAAVLDLVSKFRVSWKEKTIGIGSGACSIFPATLQNPLFENPQRIEYILADGRFHDERNYYEVLKSDSGGKRQMAMDNILTSQSIPQSSLGVHTHLTLTGRRGVRDQLIIRTVVQTSTKSKSLDFLKQHLAYMGAETATPCGHDRHPLLQVPVPATVITTSVSAPVPLGALGVRVGPFRPGEFRRASKNWYGIDAQKSGSSISCVSVGKGDAVSRGQLSRVRGQGGL